MMTKVVPFSSRMGECPFFEDNVAARLGIWLGVALAASSCIPQDQALTQPSPTPSVVPSFSGFTGLSSVQTTGATKVHLSWSASSDPSVVGYNIYNVTSLFSPQLIATIAAPADGASLSSLANETLYTFRVRAATASDAEDGNTSDLSAIPYAGVISATVLSSSSAQLTFSDGSNADSISVLCQTQAAPTYTLYQSITHVSQTTTTLTGLTSGTTYTCRVALVINGITDNNTNTVTFTPIGQATQMVFSSEPLSTTAGTVLSPAPTITLMDANNNIVTAGPDSNALVTLTLASSSPSLGSITGTASVTAVKGVASFSNLSFQTSGVKILTATKPDTSAQTNGSPSMTVNSSSFTIAAGSVSAANSSIALTPSGPLVANGISSYTVTMTLADSYGNPVSSVKPQFTSSNSSDSLTEPLTASGSNGQATGSIDTTVSGTRTLSISSPAGLTSVNTSAVFVPGTATKLAFIQQPSNSPTGAGGIGAIEVAVEDAQGNVVSSSSASITLSIFVNPSAGGVLTGTATQAAVNGVATFNGLGISKTGTGFKLVANSSPLSVAYSNSFNMTAGVPAKLAISGPSSVLSGQCSAAYTIQMQDNAGNASNATANTLVDLSGLGSGGFYTSGACAGSPLGGTITFTTGSNSKTLYFKDNAAESLTLTATDPSSVMSTGTEQVSMTPSELTLSGPASVVAGQCSSALLVRTAGANGVPGPVASATPIDFTGLTGSMGSLYSDPACTSVIASGDLNLTALATSTNVYFKDNKAETLSLSVLDPSGMMTTTSAPDVITVGASKINFTTTVSSVVAGKCSPAFVVTLQDAAGNSVATPSQETLTINGLTGTQGAFYSSASCSGSALGTTLSVPANSSNATIYFRDYSAETLSLSVSDPANVLATSQTISLGVSPSALQITGPTPATAKTDVCAGPFTINTLDGNSQVTAAINSITVNLAGAGNGGAFYSDSACSAAVSSFAFTAGTSAKTFYFEGLYPTASGSPDTFTASDNAGVLTSGTMTFAVTAAPGFIGSVAISPSGNFSFEVGSVPAAQRMDGPNSVSSLHFDSTKQYLYVSDWAAARILKYDYLNKLYIGWIGGWSPQGGISPTGSTINATLNAQCASMGSGEGWYETPGWCVGGPSSSNSANSGPTSGLVNYPGQVSDNGTYIFVPRQNYDAILRFNAQTGAFAGWIGRVGGTASAGYGSLTLQSGTGLSNACASTAVGSVTPGWCLGGSAYGTALQNRGDGGPYIPSASAFAQASTGNYIYVGNSGMINRYNADSGAFMGWVGWVGGTSPALTAAPDVTNTCASASAGQVTPGWCMGGTSSTVNAGTNLGGVDNPTGIYIDSVNDVLYVVHTDNNSTVTAYNLNSGALIPSKSKTALGWVNPQNMVSNGTSLFVADWTRLLLTDETFTTYGWVGKVSNATSMSNAVSGVTGCNTLVANADTPGWCLGGSSKTGIDEQSLNQATAIEYDGNGNLLTGEGDTFPAIKQWSAATGAYEGTLTFSNVTSPTTWSNSSTPAGLYGFHDNDEFNPAGMYTDATNGILYVAEWGNSRIKKISTVTGAVLGWIGGITTSPTGGAAGCAGAAAMGPSPGWCLGALPNPNYLWNSWPMINVAVDGTMDAPIALTSDGTYLYSADVSWNRIQKWNQSTGAYVGWIGGIGVSPTGGASGCNGAATNTFTPGWCLGGQPTSGSGNGFMWRPTGIAYASGNLYVLDQNNNRVSSYNATTGAFNGWIGAINTAPTSGCTTAANGSGYSVSTGGWCVGGTARASAVPDKGGGFSFATSYRNGIATDGTYLYIPNSQNGRVDKWSLGGVYQGSTSSRPDAYYANTWTTNTTALANFNSNSNNCSEPQGLWTDGTYLYGGIYNECGSGWQTAVWKMNLLANNPAYPSAPAGGMIGWQGAIKTTPTGGASGCSSAPSGTATPGWCQGGGPTVGLGLGMFWSAYYVTGDSNYIYVSDEYNQRITRLPK